MEYSTGPMVPTTKEIGTLTKQKDKEHSGMPKEMSTVANSKMTWPMDMENTLISTAANIKVSLKMTSKKDMERKNGLMEPNTSGLTRME